MVSDRIALLGSKVESALGSPEGGCCVCTNVPLHVLGKVNCGSKGM